MFTKLLSETKALARLDAIRTAFADQIRTKYEHRAKPCSACKTPGACCLDAHFVNVRITRLEANAIKQRLQELPDELQNRVAERIENAVEKYDLRYADGISKTYACPLFEKGIGCIVHETAKPLPCIAHACYENKNDLPPDEMLTARETEVFELNRRTYGDGCLAPIPVALTGHSYYVLLRRGLQTAAEHRHRK